ncbi:hypothetical protein EG832_20985, partial [bacterium]|nr:hypothetical protein [bacterium]
MVKFENSIHIERSREELFSFLLALDNLSKWNYYILDVKKVTSGPPDIGSGYHLIRKTDEQDLRIEEMEDHRRLVVKTLPGSRIQLQMTFILEDEGSGTLLRDEWMLSAGLPTFLERLGSMRVRSAAAENLSKL